jgi:endonuclease YncB( thermonuclease family)
MSFARELTSYAIVQDDATLKVRGYKIWLYGIYIPSTGQTCNQHVRPVRCASRAALDLEFKIGSKFARCRSQWRNRDNSLTAVCTVDGEDLSAYMLRRGWALALPDAPFEYQALEKVARERGAGMWGFPADTVRSQPRGFR